ncbi:MAG: tRNA uridine-5-carboxymethylaminomethyl(34) synthesis GTPase MnmE [Ignavibacteria bacterium]|nr:tRNA uridine-5-carboxymethylaminomethyl(34) synthesis GTPase MnmE [Ignavibacteria bacterium]
MNVPLPDTICAVATPIGVAGLAVIRVSGADCIPICDTFFVGKSALTASSSHSVHYGWWKWSGVKIDAVTCTLFRNPNSYTGEDVVEIGCHGGPYVSEQIVDSLISAGARAALPGEFTKRAFINGKLDLTQVEAIADLIHAESKLGVQIAARQLASGFTKRLNAMQSHLEKSSALLELELDFSEEDIEFVNRAQLLEHLSVVNSELESLIFSSKGAELLRSGVHCTLVGYPNAGKSSLFNAILGKDRAIVSELPGTTRDYIEDTKLIGGFTFHFFDTAGIRQTTDSIELAGITLGRGIMEQSNIILVVNDSTLGFDHSSPLVTDVQSMFPDTAVWVVQNKIDNAAGSKNDVKVATGGSSESELSVLSVPSSAISPSGTDVLVSELVSMAKGRTNIVGDALVNRRQTILLKQAQQSVNSAIEALANALSAELVAVDMRQALRHISEVLGTSFNQDILDSVFSDFCIGK